jgi:hypothetical protein
VPQTVTVTGVDEDIDDGDQVTTITMSVDDASSDDNWDPLADQTVSATTTDDDVAGFTITETAGNTTVDESGTTDTFDVVLDSEPTSSVVLTVTSGDTGEATVDKATLTFLPGTWNVPQTVTVTGVDEDIIDGSQVTTVTISVDDASSDDVYDPLADQTVSVTTTDDDVAGFTIVESGGSTSVTEAAGGGNTDTYTVVLDAEPGSNVVITVVSGDTGEATVDKATLTFLPVAWNVPQTVTVTGVDEDIDDGDQVTTITMSVDDASSDDNWDPLADQTVSATTTDDDVAGFTMTPTNGNTTVSESGTTDTLNVVLTAQPLVQVVIDVSSGDTGEASVAPTQLTFTSANWDTPQAVTVTGVADGINDGDQTTTVTAAINQAGSDTEFDLLPDETESVTTLDIDPDDASPAPLRPDS